MSLYYANAGYFETEVLRIFADHAQAKYIILDAEGINMLDSTGQMVLARLAERLEKNGVKFLVARMKRQFMQTIYKTVSSAINTDERYFSRLTYALAYAWTDMECERCDNGKNCPFRASVAKRVYEEREGIVDEAETASS
jgi:SulP family sulfate permease